MVNAVVKTGAVTVALELSVKEAQAVYAALNFVFGQLPNEEGIEPVIGETVDALANALSDEGEDVDAFEVDFIEGTFDDEDRKYDYNLRTVEV